MLSVHDINHNNALGNHASCISPKVTESVKANLKQ